MKCKFWHLAALALFAAAMAGCSTTVIEDEPEYLENKNDDAKEMSLTFKIMHNEYTRTDDNDNDAKISKLTLAFYKIDGNNYTYLYHLNAEENASGDYSVDLDPDKETPNAVIAFANLRNDESADDYSETSTIEYLESDDGLIMSSARYFNTLSGTNEYVKYTDITIDHILGKESVEIYLDRVAAKVNVTASEANLEKLVGYNSNGNKHEFTLKLIGWDVFGTDNKSYLLKNCGDSYSSLIGLLGNNEVGSSSWVWNNTDAHSLSWAHSVNWNSSSDKFPAPGKESETSHTNHMKLSEIKNEYGTAALYHETTRNANLFSTPNALPSVVLIGEYSLNGQKAQTLYRQGNLILTHDEFCEYIATLNTKEKLLFYMKDGTTKTLFNAQKVRQELEKYCSLNIISVSSLGENYMPNIVTIQIDDAFIIYPEVICYNGENPTFTESSFKELNETLLEKIGTWEIFEQGKCFFYFPIEHAGKQFDLNGEKTGSYGLVRNHRYNIEVKNISGIGHGVKNDAYVGAWPNQEFSTGVSYNVTVNEWTDVNQTIE